MIHPTMYCANVIEQGRFYKLLHNDLQDILPSEKKRCTKLFLPYAVFLKEEKIRLYAYTHMHIFVCVFPPRKKQLNFEIRISKKFMQMGSTEVGVCTCGVYESKFSPKNAWS